jgi:hypothetical protein
MEGRVVATFEVPSRHLSEGNEENNEKPVKITALRAEI